VQAVAAEDTPGPGKAAPSLLESFVCVTHKSSKNLVLQKYLAEIEKQHDALPNGTQPRGIEQELTCQACDSHMVINTRESSLVCTRCGVSRDFMEMSEANLSYEQEVTTDVVNYFAYKRLNHFTEWLNSLQAKENTEIPPEIVEAVKAEFKKARTTTRGEIKPAKVREYLKKLKLNKVRPCAMANKCSQRRTRVVVVDFGMEKLFWYGPFYGLGSGLFYGLGSDLAGFTGG
jgi:hypothetical protein